MPSSFKRFAVHGLDRGLRGKESDAKVGDGFLIAGQNLRFIRGSFYKRPGLHNTGAAALSGRVQKFFDYYNLARQQFPMCITTTTLYTLSGGVWTAVGGAGSGLTGAITIIPQFAVFSGNLICVNGVNAPFEWTGSGNATALTGGAPQTAAYILNYGSHLILGSPTLSGGILKPQRLMWSDFANENQWASGDAGFFDFSDTSDVMIQLATFGDYGIVVKNRSIWLITATASPIFYLFDKRVDVAGSICTGSVQVIPTGIIYLGDDGMVYLFNGVASQAIGEAVWPLWRGNIPYANIQNCVSAVDPLRGEYLCWVNYGGSTDNSAAMVYNYYEGTFSFDTTAITGAGTIANLTNVTWNLLTQGWNTYGQTWTASEFAAGQPLVYCSQGTNVLYMSADLNDLGTTPINASATLPLRHFDKSDPTRLEIVRAVAIFYQSTGTSAPLTVQLGYTNFDDQTQVNYLAAATVDQSQAGKIIAYFDDVPSIFHTVQLSNNVLNQNMKVTGVVYYVKSRGPALGAP